MPRTSFKGKGRHALACRKLIVVAFWGYVKYTIRGQSDTFSYIIRLSISYENKPEMTVNLTALLLLFPSLQMMVMMVLKHMLRHSLGAMFILVR